jgi:DNA transposase THAP9
VNAEPGFLTEVLNVLPQFPDCDRDVNLVSDAMAIKKGKIWDPAAQKFIGFIDYGNSSTMSDTQATEALFFMLVSLNGKWKLPPS